MVKKWKGIKEIVEKATKDLIETKENGYLFYSAPEGYNLILSVDIIKPLTFGTKIKDFGIAIDGKKDKILRRGFIEGDNTIITDIDEPFLEMVEGEGLELEEIKMRIKEERRKAQYRIQGRMLPQIIEEES